MPKITPFLWFDAEALPAAKYYVSIFKKNSKIKLVSRYGRTGPGKAGAVMTVQFQLNGQEFVGLNGGPHYTFNQAVSFVVYCANQKEIDYYWKKLSAGGEEIQCGWLKDRYGLCWQIVPANLPRLLDPRNPEGTERFMAAMMKMVKFDIAALEAAHAGTGVKAPRRIPRRPRRA